MTDPNPARGQVVAPLAGVPRALCLTLGALSELEGVFKTTDWKALADRLKTPSASDLISVLGALLRGAGEGEFASKVAEAAVTPVEAVEAVAAAFHAAVG